MGGRGHSGGAVAVAVVEDANRQPKAPVHPRSPGPPSAAQRGGMRALR
jgi:hypothetical protein